MFQVSLLIRRELTERAKDFSLILDDVAITELSFSREYTAAVEAKQVGEFNLRLERVGCFSLFINKQGSKSEVACHFCIDTTSGLQAPASLVVELTILFQVLAENFGP